MQRPRLVWCLLSLVVATWPALAAAAPTSGKGTRARARSDRCATFAESHRYEACFQCASARYRAIRRRHPPDLVWLLAMCSAQSAMQMDDGDDRVDRLTDAYLEYEKYLQREDRPKYTSRVIDAAERMRAIKALIARDDHGAASILVDPPQIPLGWMPHPRPRATAIATLATSSRRFIRNPETLPTCQLQTLWRHDRGFDRGFLAELIALIAKFPDARFGLAMPRAHGDTFPPALIDVYLRLRTDVTFRETHGFPADAVRNSEQWRYLAAFDVTRLVDAPDAGFVFTVRHRGVEIRDVEQCQDVRAAVLDAAETAGRQEDAMLRPIEERRAQINDPPAPIAPVAPAPTALDPAAREYLASAIVLARDGKYDAALAHAKLLLTQYPDAPEVLAPLLAWQATTRQCDGALDVYAKLVALRAPIETGTHDAAAKCAQTLGRFDVALEAMEQSVAGMSYIDPEVLRELADAFWKLASIQRESGDEPWIAMEKAQRYYRDYLQRDRDPAHQNERAETQRRLDRLTAGVIPEAAPPPPQTPEQRTACYQRYGLFMRSFVRKLDGSIVLQINEPDPETPCPPR